MTYEEADRICDIMWQMDINNGDIQRVREALEKQIPKKPIKYKANWLGDDKYTAYDCPTCKKCFTMKGFFEGRNAFCDICGQAIDWSDEE